jgi:hypothetical protein
MARRPFGGLSAYPPSPFAMRQRYLCASPRLGVSASEEAVANRDRNLTSHCDIWLRPWPRCAAPAALCNLSLLSHLSHLSHLLIS